MKFIEPEQWRVMGTLIALCGERARLDTVLKQQEVSPEAVCDLAERGLIVTKLNGDEVDDLTPGLIKTYRRKLFLTMSTVGQSYVWNDPHRVLRSPGRARNGLSLTYMLGMLFIEDLAGLSREGLITAATEDDTIDLDGAHRPFSGSSRVILSGGAEVWTDHVIIRTTKAGQLYVERY